ncbi:MAG: dihydroxyacetone kinase subunit DhaL [Pseudomonadota bacterium]
MSTQLILDSADAVSAALAENEDVIEGLDRAIGDGDHYHNIKRGAETITALREELEDQTPDVALQKIGMKLLSTIGGASGPLIASFFMAMAKTEGSAKMSDQETIARMVSAGVEAIGKRGKSGLGEKTMLDVLIPIAEALTKLSTEGHTNAEIASELKKVAEAGMLSTKNMLATKGRASFLGERAIGHIDPGAMSCKVIIATLCDRVTT